MKKNSKKSAPAPRNVIAKIMNERYAHTGTIMHDRRQDRDRNRGQTRNRAIEEG